MKHIKALNKYFWKYKKRLSVGIFFIVISNYFGVLAPQVTGFIIDFVQRTLPGYQPRSSRASYDIMVQKFIQYVEGLGGSSMQVVIISGLTILVLALLRGFFMFLMRQTIIVMSRHIEYDQKNEIFDHYQKLDLSFYKRNTTGDLMSRMAEDVSKVRMFTGPAIMYLVNLITLISLSVFFMFKRQPELTMYVLAPLPILAFIIYYVNTIIHRKSEQVQRTLADINTNAQQTYSGIRVVKSFAQEEAVFKHFENISDSYKQKAVGLAKVEAMYFPSMTLLIGLSTLLTIMIGGMYYINGSNDVGIDTIIEFVIYINMLTFPVSAIGWTASMIQRASASQKRLNEFLDAEPLIYDTPSATDVTLSGNIVLKDVNFHYPNTGVHAIKNLNLEINRGDRVAIIGRTGSGKTTLAQLLLRLYKPDSGVILFDGYDLNQMKLDSLRKQVSYVPQDGFLFSDTVANNITFGASRNKGDNIKEAARMAVVNNDIESLPEKYETEIGERGVSLSGGQKQRISIARAFLKDAQVLIMDDCLSAVDSKTEKEIINNLSSSFENTTCILITHRIFHLVDFDNIIVLDHGEIKEQGTHNQLLERKGIYFSMFQKQINEISNE